MAHFDPNKYDLNGDYAWLNDCVVEYRVQEKKGRWWVTMVFINSDDPNECLLKEIDHYPTQQKAELYAGFFQRQIRRDPRGTKKINRK